MWQDVFNFWLKNSNICTIDKIIHFSNILGKCAHHYLTGSGCLVSRVWLLVIVLILTELSCCTYFNLISFVLLLISPLWIFLWPVRICFIIFPLSNIIKYTHFLCEMLTVNVCYFCLSTFLIFKFKAVSSKSSQYITLQNLAIPFGIPLFFTFNLIAFYLKKNSGPCHKSYC